MKIVLLGDTALIGKYDVIVGKSYLSRLKTIKEYLSQFDYVICNLECPLTDVSQTWIPKSMHLRSPKKNIEILKYLGVNAVSLANNHIYDFGKKGLLETVQTLEDNDIEWFGTNGKYVKLRNKQDSINISGFCCASTNGFRLRKGCSSQNYINLLCKELVQKQLQEDARVNAFSLIVPHWGQEHTFFPSKETINIARKIAGMKRNLAIVAHHPHQIQGIEKSNGNLIAYSLGNFLFDDCVSKNGMLKVPMIEVNKKMFALVLEIVGNELIDYEVQGIHDEDAGLVLFDIGEELNGISEEIKDYDTPEYDSLRMNQIACARQKKFGKRDLKWALSRLNYYSIGAKIMTYQMKRLLNKVETEFEKE